MRRARAGKAWYATAETDTDTESDGYNEAIEKVYNTRSRTQRGEASNTTSLEVNVAEEVKVKEEVIDVKVEEEEKVKVEELEEEDVMQHISVEFCSVIRRLSRVPASAVA